MLEELIRVLGESAALRLVRAMGGMRVQIPSTRRGRLARRIAEAIGEDAAQRLIAHFGGEIVEIPPRSRLRARMLPARVREMRASGMCASEIAAALGISERRVRQLLKA